MHGTRCVCVWGGGGVEGEEVHGRGDAWALDLGARAGKILSPHSQPHVAFPHLSLSPPPQTAQYSTQIFSLAVLLSSLFVYNQVWGEVWR